ncbi:MAG: hypothetical protein KDC57_04735 [Saprospiraceae bacterium]|nr:hypothetical protein [Saprospiraceae bacterium]
MSKKPDQKKGKLKGTWMMFRNLPYVYFLCGVGLIYIANAHYAEKKMRRIQHLTKEVEQLRWQYNSLKSDYLYQSTESQIQHNVSSLELSDRNNAPRAIEKKQRR